MAETKATKCAHPGCECRCRRGPSIAAIIARAWPTAHPSPASVGTRSVLPGRRRVLGGSFFGTKTVAWIVT